MRQGVIAAAAGTALIFVASVIYAILPPEVVLPVGNPADPANWPGHHLTQLQLAGRLGVIGDVLLIAGALRLARQSHAWFWGLNALTTLFFVGFDYTTARLLAATSPEQMPLLRELMSGLFLIGLVIFGLAALDAPIAATISKTGGAILLATACLWFFVGIPPLIYGLWLFAALALIAAALYQTGLSTRAVT